MSKVNNSTVMSNNNNNNNIDNPEAKAKECFTDRGYDYKLEYKDANHCWKKAFTDDDMALLGEDACTKLRREQLPCEALDYYSHFKECIGDKRYEKYKQDSISTHLKRCPL